MSLISKWFERSSDYRQQRELFKLSFPETLNTPIISDQHYEWKFKNFPANPASYEFCSSYEGDLVGYYAALPYQYMIHNKKYLCGMVCDVMTHPKMRGQGVFTKLGVYSTTEMAKAEVDFVSGYPIRPEVIPGHIKVGWFIGFKEPLYIRVLAVNNLVKKKFLAPVYPLINFLVKSVQFAWNFILLKKGEITLQTQSEFLSDTEYEEFFNEWSKKQNCYLIKDKNFIKWRTSAPHTQYQFFKLKDKNKVMAWAVCRITTLQGVPVLAILDLMAVSDSCAHLNKLHSELLSFACKSNLDAVVSMLSHELAVRYKFYLNLWVPTPAVFSIIFKIFNKNLNEEIFKKRSDWHLMWIDCDDL